MRAPLCNWPAREKELLICTTDTAMETIPVALWYTVLQIKNRLFAGGSHFPLPPQDLEPNGKWRFGSNLITYYTCHEHTANIGSTELLFAVSYISSIWILGEQWCFHFLQNGRKDHEFPCPMQMLYNLISGYKTSELPDIGASSGRFCSTHSAPEGNNPRSPKHSGYCHRRIIWRDACCLVSDEISPCSSWVSAEQDGCWQAVLSTGKFLERIAYFDG